MESQNQSQDFYTLGIWTIRAGKEKEFIDQWTRFAKWTSENFPQAQTGYLLQDEKNALRFISFGAWRDEAGIKQWRDSVEFRKFVVVARDLCEDFQPNTLRLVSSSG